MLTFFHFGFNVALYYFFSFSSLVEFNWIGVVFLFLADLIDLDHLFSRPIYHPRRNPFKIHPIHKNWRFVLMFSFVLLFFYPYVFLGLGLISHLFIDWIYYVKVFEL